MRHALVARASEAHPGAAGKGLPGAATPYPGYKGAVRIAITRCG